jgi:Ca2+/Na+ antiporter
MNSNVSGITSIVLVVVAISSLISMIALTRIDGIVHRDLYNYGLTFNYAWAIPYWTMTILIFAMGWFNIIVAIAFQFYVLLYGRRRAETMAPREAYKPESTQQPPIQERPQATPQTKTEIVERREVVAPPVEVTPSVSRESEEPPITVKAPPVEQQRPFREQPTETMERREEMASPVESEVREEPYGRAEVSAEEPREEYVETAQEVEILREQRTEVEAEQEFEESRKAAGVEVLVETPTSKEAREKEEQEQSEKTEQQEAETAETSTY